MAHRIAFLLAVALALTACAPSPRQAPAGATLPGGVALGEAPAAGTPQAPAESAVEAPAPVDDWPVAHRPTLPWYPVEPLPCRERELPTASAVDRIVHCAGEPADVRKR